MHVCIRANAPKYRYTVNSALLLMRSIAKVCASIRYWSIKRSAISSIWGAQILFFAKMACAVFRKRYIITFTQSVCKMRIDDTLARGKCDTFYCNAMQIVGWNYRWIRCSGINLQMLFLDHHIRGRNRMLIAWSISLYLNNLRDCRTEKSTELFSQANRFVVNKLDFMIAVPSRCLR